MLPRPVLRAVAATVSLVATVACASHQQGSSDDESGPRTRSGAPDAAVAPPRSQRDVITVQEIRANTASNALDLVRQLRPGFLTSRGPVSFQDPDAGKVLVYVNGTKYGFAESLSQIATIDITEIRYITAVDATQRWGIGHSGGVIYVTIGAR